VDSNDQFTLKAASVLRRVRNFPLTDAHFWGDAEPDFQYPDPMPHRNSLAHRVTTQAEPAQPEPVQPLPQSATRAP